MGRGSEQLVDVNGKVRLRSKGGGIAIWLGEIEETKTDNGTRLKEVWEWMPESVFDDLVEDNKDGTLTMPEWVAVKFKLCRAVD